MKSRQVLHLCADGREFVCKFFPGKDKPYVLYHRSYVPTEYGIRERNTIWGKYMNMSQVIMALALIF